MKLLDEKGLTTVWAAIKNTFLAKSAASSYAKTADVNTALAKKVDAVSGKGLSTNDFTAAYKSKLDGIATGANNYKLPVASTTALGGIKTNYVPKSGNTLFKVNTDTEGNANTYIPGLIYGNDEYLSEIEFTADSNEYTSFDGKDFHSYDQEGTDKCTISLPDKDGTLALTSDLPQVSKASSYGMTEKGMIDVEYRNIQQIILLDKSGAYNISNWYKNSPEGSILDMYPYGLSGGSLNSDINNLFKKMGLLQNGPHLEEVSALSISYSCHIRLIHINNAVLIAEYVINDSCNEINTKENCLTSNLYNRKALYRR